MADDDSTIDVDSVQGLSKILSILARRPMRVGVYISGGVTLFDLIRYAADIIRGVFGVFGFNLDCDFHGSRLLASCCNRVDRRRRTTAPISATARDLFMIPNASRTTGTRCAATQITHGRYATSATTDNATALHQAMSVDPKRVSRRPEKSIASTRKGYSGDCKDREQFHVSMLHVPFGPWQRIRVNSQRDV